MCSLPALAVGSLGAILFAEAGLKVAAIEKEADVYTLPRAVNLDGEIIRALQPIGLAATVKKMMQPLRCGERVGFANAKREWLFGVDAQPMGSNGWQPANMLISRNSRLFCGGRLYRMPT